MPSEAILESVAASKRFGNFTAVDQVSYRLYEGEAAGIIGPNGAGKSTFFNLLTGLYTPTSGTISFYGRDVTRLSAEQRVRMGVVRTFQLVSVFDTLSVLDNLVLTVARLAHKSGAGPGFLIGSAHPGSVLNRCNAALDRVGIRHLAGMTTASLSYGDKRKLEIAMALAIEPRVLLLDEPLAGLSDAEIREIIALITNVRKELTLVIIEHKISRIVELVSRLSVMHEGRLIADGPPDKVLAEPLVRQVYWGTDDTRKFSGLSATETAGA